MGEQKIPRDWYVGGDTIKRPKHRIEVAKALTIEDLPQTLDARQTAKQLGLNKPNSHKTIERIWRKREMKSFPLGGKRVTTPEFIGEYLLKKMRDAKAI